MGFYKLDGHSVCRMSPLPRLVVSSHSGNSHQGAVPDSAAANIDENLHMFREALAISGRPRLFSGVMVLG
jgi:hypothetical protein